MVTREAGQTENYPRPRTGNSEAAGGLLLGRQTYAKKAVVGNQESRWGGDDRRQEGARQGMSKSDDESRSPRSRTRDIQQPQRPGNPLKPLPCALALETDPDDGPPPEKANSQRSIASSAAGGFSPLDLLMSAPPPPRHSAAVRLSRGRSNSRSDGKAKGSKNARGNFSASMPATLPTFPGLFRMELDRESDSGHERSRGGIVTQELNRGIFLPDPDLF